MTESTFRTQLMRLVWVADNADNFFCIMTPQVHDYFLRKLDSTGKHTLLEYTTNSLDDALDKAVSEAVLDKGN